MIGYLVIKERETMNRDTRNEDRIADVLTEKVLTAYSRLDNTRLCELVSGCH
jgi:hypothetical protein